MWENITSTTKGDASWEIIIMLLVAFLLGLLLRHLFGNKDNSAYTKELDELRRKNAGLKADLDECLSRPKATVSSATASVGAAVGAALGIASMAKPESPDDLKKIEGIGPKIEEILNNAGIWTFGSLANSKAEAILKAINAIWPENKVHDPTTWPKQAEMARDGKWTELLKWQDELKGGK